MMLRYVLSDTSWQLVVACCMLQMSLWLLNSLKKKTKKRAAEGINPKHYFHISWFAFRENRLLPAYFYLSQAGFCLLFYFFLTLSLTESYRSYKLKLLELKMWGVFLVHKISLRLWVSYCPQNLKIGKRELFPKLKTCQVNYKGRVSIPNFSITVSQNYLFKKGVKIYCSF